MGEGGVGVQVEDPAPLHGSGAEVRQASHSLHGCCGNGGGLMSTNTPITEGANVDSNVGTESQSSSSRVKRKTTNLRSNVWEHFKKIEGENKCQCNYCGTIYSCDPVSCGTSTLRKHLNVRCKKYPFSGASICASKQVQVSPHSPLVGEGTEGESRNTVLNWKFDQQLSRKALAYMVIVDELPFKFVEGQGFRHFCSVSQPKFHIPSRITVARDCFDIYVEEMSKLKSFIKNNCRKVCLTTDTWTSLQRINYMCLTAHFIDNDWKLIKKILNFCPISSHKGEAIGKAIEKCLNSWGIEKVMTVTVDNASSNDVAIAYLKRRINNWEGSVLKGEFIHMRCVAHIVNLVVNDGLKLANESVARVRNAVRYVRQSPSRLQKFKSCVEEEKIQSKSLLCLDVPTRWNSTFMMLDTAQKFQKAFERFEEQDPFFLSELSEGDGLGKPQDEDWEKVRDLTKLLESFYDVTLRVSGTLYVTSNTYFHEISNVDCLLKEWCGSDDYVFSDMAFKMKLKCDKYWGNPEKLNLMMFIAVVLDPRYKLVYVEFSISQMYENDMSLTLMKRVKATLFALFDEYKNLEGTSSGQQEDMLQNLSSTSTSNRLYHEQPAQKIRSILKDRFHKHIAEMESEDVQSELVKYLEEVREKDVDSFDILAWWKINSSRFPILSLMARDVLAIPVSTVASESAFSTGGRVLDAFRSYLSPKIVEALICTQDWVRISKDRLSIEEKLDEVEQLDKELSSVTSAPLVIDIA